MRKVILCADTLGEDIVDCLSCFVDEVKMMPRCDDVPGGIGYHPDMLGFADGSTLWLNDVYYQKNAAFFDELGVCVVPCAEQYGVYPLDVRFNAFAVGRVLVGHRASLSAAVVRAFDSVCDVKQGYAKCSSAVFGNNLITADRGIAVAAEALGASVLLIEPGSILLEGYDYGFIGGALVEVSDDTLVAFGDMSAHPQGAEIEAFANSKGYHIISFANRALTDHGGILVLNIQEN